MRVPRKMYGYTEAEALGMNVRELVICVEN